MMARRIRVRTAKTLYRQERGERRDKNSAYSALSAVKIPFCSAYIRLFGVSFVDRESRNSSLRQM
jgi:hypothetical protein